MKVQDIFKWASASFALIPGLITMTTSLGTPRAFQNISTAV